MSSHRNKAIQEYNETNFLNDLPLTDWGYEGFFCSEYRQCMADLIVSTCQFGSRYEPRAAWTIDRLYMLKHDDRLLAVEDDRYPPFQLGENIVRINGHVVDFSDHHPLEYRWSDVEYAASYLVRHPDTTRISLVNWETESSFILTREPK